MFILIFAFTISIEKYKNYTLKLIIIKFILKILAYKRCELFKFK